MVTANDKVHHKFHDSESHNGRLSIQPKTQPYIRMHDSSIEIGHTSTGRLKKWSMQVFLFSKTSKKTYELNQALVFKYYISQENHRLSFQ